MDVVKIIATVREQLSALTGLSVDTVSRVSREGKGWVVDVEMVELRRTPNNRDLLATYHVRLDASGNIVTYLCAHRYHRGEVRP